MNRPALPVLTLLKGVLVFLGIGALAGGLVLIIAPDGAIIHMPTSLLARTPFTNFLIPGLILFSVNGLFPLFNAYALHKQPSWPALNPLGAPFGEHWSFVTTGAQGIALVIWISVELLTIGSHWLMVFYGVVGLLIIALTLSPAVRGALKTPRLSTRAVAG